MLPFLVAWRIETVFLIMYWGYFVLWVALEAALITSKTPWYLKIIGFIGISQLMYSDFTFPTVSYIMKCLAGEV
jgi:hypothetical protein